MDCSGAADRRRPGRAPSLCIAPGIDAGRGLLRAQSAVVLHRDAPIWTASGCRSGRGVCPGDLSESLTSRGVRDGSGMAVSLRQEARLPGRAVPLGDDGTRADAPAGHRLSLEFTRVCGRGKSCVRSTDGDYGNFWSFARGRVLQRTFGLDDFANFATKVERFENMARRDICIACDWHCGPPLRSASPSRPYRAFGADKFSRVQRLSFGLDDI